MRFPSASFNFPLALSPVPIPVHLASSIDEEGIPPGGRPNHYALCCGILAASAGPPAPVDPQTYSAFTRRCAGSASPTNRKPKQRAADDQHDDHDQNELTDTSEKASGLKLGGEQADLSGSKDHGSQW